MKWLYVLLLVPSLAYGDFQTDDHWTGSDKRAHAYTGALIGASVTLFSSWEYGTMAGCAAGAVKEYIDARHPQHHDSSFQDFAVTCMGAFVGSRISQYVFITPRSLVFKRSF